MSATPSTDSLRSIPRVRSPLQRVVKWLLVLAGLVVGLAILIGVVLALMDWNRYKPWVNEKISEATGRRFEIEGDLSAAWRWPQPLEEGWRRWIPGVTVKAERLVMDNPTGFEPPFSGDDDKKSKAKDSNKAQITNAARAPVSAATVGSASASTPPTTATVPGTATMASIGSVSASISLLPLLRQHLAIDTVALTDPEIALARTKDGANNWTFKHKDPDAPKSRWTFDVDRLVVNQGLLAYADAMKDVDLQARVNTTEPIDPSQAGSAKAAKPGILPASAAASSAEAAASRDVAASKGSASGAPVPYGLKFELQGRIAKAQVRGSGRAGQVISLRDKVVNYPLQIEATAADAALSAEGILANPGALSGMDFDVVLKADSMADLYEVTGLVLPSTPPFETRGHLTGSLEPERAVWSYSDFKGKVGQSDLQGDLKYTSGKPRPKLTGSMTSNQLRLADLGPALGTTASDNTHRGKAKGNDKGKVLPDAKFAAERWNAMDMDILFKGKNIIRPESLPLENLSLHAVMNNAQLKLAPLTFGVAEGKIESEVSIDGREPPLKAQIRGKVEGLKLSALFPKVELMKKSFGRMDGAVALQSQGNSVAGLLGKGTGEARLYVREGTLSKQMLDLAALNVGSIVVGKLFGDDKEVHLRCAVADFTVVNGLAKTRVVKMSTDDAVIEATGTIDLGTEAMDLRIKPESLEWKFFSLRTPLYVKGTFGNPNVGVEPGPLLLRAGAAVVAAVAAPVALAVIPITVPAADDDTYCKPLLDLAKEPVKPGAQGAAGTASEPARRAASKPGPARG